MQISEVILICVFQEKTCFIDWKCYEALEKNPENSTYICNPLESHDKWSPSRCKGRPLTLINLRLCFIFYYFHINILINKDKKKLEVQKCVAHNINTL
jgi:hypothetical protein